MKTTDFSTYLFKGAVANLPVAASVAAYGSVLGVLAAQKGISWTTLLLMNLSIFAGSAQFVMVEMWVAPLPIVEIIFAAAIINFRYLLIGASLNPIFQGTSLAGKSLMMHFVADENWAVTMTAYRTGSAAPGFLLGGGICLATVWSCGTMIGHQFGALISDPKVFALDFAFLAVFTALAISLWRGKADILPWIITALASILADQLLPGKWYIAIGGVCGALVSALLPWHTKGTS